MLGLNFPLPVKDVYMNWTKTDLVEIITDWSFLGDIYKYRNQKHS